MREPVFVIGEYGLLERGSRCRVILAFEARSAEEREGLSVVRVQIRRRSQVSSSLREIPLLKIQIPKKEIQFRAGGRQLIGVVEMLLRVFELSRLESRNCVLGLFSRFR